MKDNDLASELEYLFNPEFDEDMSPREYPSSRLMEKYGLSFEYMEGFHWEGSTGHKHTRLCKESNTGLTSLIRNHDVPLRLFEAAFRLFGDSLIVYAKTSSPPHPLRFYPPIVLTFWSAFEALVRQLAATMLITCKDIPDPIRDFLGEVNQVVLSNGDLKERSKHTAVLERYVVLLRYGAGITIDRGNMHWQRLERAQQLRNDYTHVQAMESRPISAGDVLKFMESVMLGILWPSSLAKRTLLLGSHHLYEVWAHLKTLTKKHLPEGNREEPYLHSMLLKDKNFLFYCPFDSVDPEQFPSFSQGIEEE